VATVIEGVIVGGAGGAVAGVSVYLVQFIHSKLSLKTDERVVYSWLKNNTTNESGNQFRSTRAIASWNNLTEDRVRFVCSQSKRVFLSTGKVEDIWGIHEREETLSTDFIHG
jgi:hypothetical protein